MLPATLGFAHISHRQTQGAPQSSLALSPTMVASTPHHLRGRDSMSIPIHHGSGQLMQGVGLIHQSSRVIPCYYRLGCKNNNACLIVKIHRSRELCASTTWECGIYLSTCSGTAYIIKDVECPNIFSSKAVRLQQAHSDWRMPVAKCE